MNELLTSKLKGLKPIGAWNKGVKDYALELVEGAEVELTRDNALSALLNGAENWKQYSYSGCALIYNHDIAKRLADSGTLKITKNGELEPNGKETWLDVQARALVQAYNLIEGYLERR